MIIKSDENKIVEALSSGKVLAIKTDTVYGLICDAYNKYATDKIYRVKQREAKKPLSIFVKSKDDVEKYVDKNVLTDKVFNIMKMYWPGALTIVLKKKNELLDNITCGLDSIGIRMPNDTLLLSVLNKIDFPLAQTSCNLSGEKEYKDIHTIDEKFGNEIDYIIDGGEILQHVASTVIKVDNDHIKILRQGVIKIDE